MYVGKTFKAKTKEELLSPPFVHRFQQYINNTIAPMKKQFNIPNTKVFIKQGEKDAYTDGFSIIIGSKINLLMNPYVSLNNASLMVLGLVFHELGHVLYTPFTATNLALTSFKGKRFWPSNPLCKEADDIIEYIEAKEENLLKMFDIYKDMENIFEDGRIEAILLLKNGQRGKYAHGLRLLRKKHYKLSFRNISEVLDELDTMTDGPDKVSFSFQLYMEALLVIAKYGNFKGLEARHEGHPFIVDINRLSDYISNMLDSINATDFYENLNMLFAKSFDKYIKPYLDTLPSLEELKKLMEVIKSVTGSDVKKISKKKAEEIEEATIEAKKALSKSSKPSSSGENKSSEPESKSSSSKDPKKAAPEAKASKDTSSEKNEEESEDGSTASSPGIRDTIEEGEAFGESTSTAEVTVSEGAATHENSSTVLAPESHVPLKIKRVSTETVWAGDEGCVDELDDSYDKTHELDLEAIGKTAVTFDSKDDEILDSLEISKDLDYGISNKNLRIGITRIEDPIGSHSFLSYTRYIIAGQLAAKKIKPFLKRENKVFYERNRFSGARFKASRTANPNLRYFDKKTTVPQSPTLSVAILVDQSGSMGGRNIEIARATAFSLFEMCSELEVPFAVFGHSADTHGYDVLIDNYCFFGEASEKDKKKLLKIHAGGNNRDGAALRYVSEILAKRETEKKLLFIISDGQPAAFGYYGSAAEKDIQAVVKEYEKLGIRFVAAAIDADKQQIKDIYEAHRFLNIDDVETLPAKLMLIVKKALGR